MQCEIFVFIVGVVFYHGAVSYLYFVELSESVVFIIPFSACGIFFVNKTVVIVIFAFSPIYISVIVPFLEGFKSVFIISIIFDNFFIKNFLYSFIIFLYLRGRRCPEYRAGLEQGL